MSTRERTHRPSRAPFDSEFEKEESGVQRSHPPSESIAERTRRIDHKVSVANLVLSRLSPTAPKARLLASAMLRRDEVLLDGVLGGMTEEVVALVSERSPRARAR